MTDDAANAVDGRCIPNLDRLHCLGLPRWPPGDAMVFLDDPTSGIPLAAVCLNDAYYMVAEARYALLEGFRNVEHYRGKQPSNGLTAAWMGQYYASDVALRLYAAGEHLANAIMQMLKIDRLELKRYEKGGKKGRASHQAVVARFLKAQMPSHSISTAVDNLGMSVAWAKTVEYRNLWVHAQPPLISGMGLAYQRGKKYWSEFTDIGSRGYELRIGGGDKPELSVDELLEGVREASCTFMDAFVTVGECYNAILADAAARNRG
jgi:hypothetical protein